MSKRTLPLLLALVQCAALAHAQAPESERHRLYAVRVQAAPVLDGALDEEAWQTAPFVSDFTQKEPDQGRPATLRTEVAFVYDDKALYVGARLYSDRPEDVETVLTRRDESGPAERLIISLDTWRDRRTAYSFAVTAAGVRVDWFHPIDNEYSRDSSFNPVWEARTRLTAEGWVAELRIPFSQLRFSPAEEQVWGINLNRYIPRRNEDDFWVVVPRDITAWSSWFGELHGIQGIAPSSRLELLPYAAGELELYTGQPPRAGTPFASRPPYTGRVGLDTKLGLGPNFTLDATLNPDFGQVELDPAQVNLSAFELVFDERRPFFTEGSQLFTASSGPMWFYSRRIGSAPRLSAAGDFVETPRATTLLGAAKVTGRMPSGLSLGVLSALTDEAWADTYDYDTGEVGRTRLEPRSGWAVARAQQEFGDEASVVGATFTGVLRDNLGGEGRTGELVRQSYAGGVDWNLRFLQGEYVLAGHAGGSFKQGSAASILRLQRSSARFFQRPDQPHVRLDPQATSLAGYTGGLRLSRQSGTHWLWEVGTSVRTPGFEINDVGQLFSADDVDVEATLTWRETEPGPLLRGYSLSLNSTQTWNLGGVHTDSEVALTANATLPNFWSASLRLFYFPRVLSDDLTRGGPLMEFPQGVFMWGRLANNPADTTRWNVVVSSFWDELGGDGITVRGALSVQPVPSLQLSVEPLFYAGREVPQYVSTQGGGREETYGQRYIFAAVERRELILRLRANLFLTPDLSLEAYAEPFAASGVFSGFGELERPRSMALRRYGEAAGTSLTRGEGGSLEVVDGGAAFSVANPDFNLRSFRSNVVLRWEWLPGSTLFLVWQQDRFQGSATGPALSPRGVVGALQAPGRHTLAIKLSWWLPAA